MNRYRTNRHAPNLARTIQAARRFSRSHESTTPVLHNVEVADRPASGVYAGQLAVANQANDLSFEAPHDATGENEAPATS